mmetsp:Transcript_31586/g.91510  ORF Transcript_31586/g.91510 Transcript_31586/m.91510 type:complete len:274 (-) Transcript_31586:450-1271(-)
MDVWLVVWVSVISSGVWVTNNRRDVRDPNNRLLAGIPSSTCPCTPAVSCPCIQYTQNGRSTYLPVQLCTYAHPHPCHRHHSTTPPHTHTAALTCACMAVAGVFRLIHCSVTPASKALGLMVLTGRHRSASRKPKRSDEAAHTTQLHQVLTQCDSTNFSISFCRSWLSSTILRRRTRERRSSRCLSTFLGFRRSRSANTYGTLYSSSGMPKLSSSILSDAMLAWGLYRSSSQRRRCESAYTSPWTHPMANADLPLIHPLRYSSLARRRKSSINS